MQKLKAFLYILKNSLLSPKYYAEVLAQKPGFSFKYYFMLALVASLVVGAMSLWQVVPQTTKALNEFLDAGAKLYPADLTISLKEGKLSINKQSPYSVEIPQQFKYLEKDKPNADLNNGNTGPKNLVVFDENGTLDDLKKYDTLALVNTVNIIVVDPSTGKIQVTALKEIPDGEISQSILEEMIASIRPFVKVIASGAVVLLFILILVNNLVFKFVDFAIIGLILLLVGRLKGLSFGFGQYVRVAMHAATLAFVLDVFFAIFKVTPGIDMWFLLTTLFYGLVVLVSLSSGKAKRDNESEKQPLTGEVV